MAVTVDDDTVRCAIGSGDSSGCAAIESGFSSTVLSFRIVRFPWNTVVVSVRDDRRTRQVSCSFRGISRCTSRFRSFYFNVGRNGRFIITVIAADSGPTFYPNAAVVITYPWRTPWQVLFRNFVYTVRENTVEIAHYPMVRTVFRPHVIVVAGRQLHQHHVQMTMTADDSPDAAADVDVNETDCDYYFYKQVSVIIIS